MKWVCSGHVTMDTPHLALFANLKRSQPSLTFKEINDNMLETVQDTNLITTEVQ